MLLFDVNDDFAGNYTSAEWAMHTKELLKKKNIKSPDLTKMHRLEVGKATYFFYTKKKMRRMLDKINQEQIKSNAEEKLKEKLRNLKGKTCGHCAFLIKEGGRHYCNKFSKPKRTYKKISACEHFKNKGAK